MSKAIAVLLMLQVFVAAAGAQTDDRLNARKAKFLLIDFDSVSTKVRYRIAADEDYKDLKQPLTLTGGRESVVAWVSFRNPLRVSWTLSEKVTDDPMSTALSRFAASANAFFSAPFEATPESEKRALAVPASTDPEAVKLARETNLSGIQAPPPLVAWALFASQHLYCIDAARITDIKTRLENANRLLYNTDEARRIGVKDTIRTLGELRAMLKVAVGKLGAESYEVATLRMNAQTSDSAIAAIDDYVRRSSIAIAEVMGALAKTPRAAPDCAPFFVYSDNAFRIFEADAKGNLKLREQVAKDLRALHSQFVSRLEMNPVDRGYRVGEIDVTPGKVKDVTMVITRRSLKIEGEKVVLSDDKSVSGTVRFAPFERWFVEFAPGVAYTNVRIQKYGTSASEGTTTVALGGRETNPVVGTGMLNLIRSWEDGGSVWPMLQAGFAVGKTPMLLAGGGIRVTRPSNFSVGVGAALPWVKQLNTLKVGDTIAGTADLEKDYVQGFARRPGFYVSVQRSF